MPEIIDSGYTVHMKLTINHLGEQDYGIYKCISKNSLGDTDGTINIYSEFSKFIDSWGEMCVFRNF